MAALVDGDDLVTGGCEAPGDAVPQTSVGCQAVHEKERSTRARRLAHGHAETGQRHDRVGQLRQFRHDRTAADAMSSITRATPIDVEWGSTQPSAPSMARETSSTMSR